MQCSAILSNLTDVAMEEGHLPDEFHIGADNTYKETKNQVCFWFAVWLLCVLQDTNLWVVSFSFLLVGHTHDALDRFFSRLVAAIAGRDFFTVDQLFATAQQNLNYCNLKARHLAQTWGWKGLQSLPVVKAVSGLGPVHAIKFYRSSGIWVQWKQWMTDEDWSQPVLLLTPEDMNKLANFEPTRHTMEFPNGGQNILDWVGKFEHWCTCLPNDTYPDLDRSVAWLRAAVEHALPGAYAPGQTVHALVHTLTSLPHCRPHQSTRTCCPTLPQDILTQLFPGSDVPAIPAEALLKIEGITHIKGQRVRSNTIVPGSLLLVRVNGETTVLGHKIPFLVAVAAQTRDKYVTCDKILVAWMLPQLGKSETFRHAIQTHPRQTHSMFLLLLLLLHNLKILCHVSTQPTCKEWQEKRCLGHLWHVGPVG